MSARRVAARRTRSLAAPRASSRHTADYYIDIYLENNPYLGGCSLHDPLAVGVAADSSLVVAHGCNLKVDLEGAFRGRTIGDDERLNVPEKTCEVALEVDVPRFLREFMTRVGRALAGGR